MKVKICGLTGVEEAEYLNRNRVDFAGFVLFYPRSRRNIEVGRAKEIMKKLRPQIQSVAVTVAPGAEEIERIEEAGFNYIQIHGELPEEILTRIHIPVLKAFNSKDLEQYERYRKYGQIAGYVFDAQEPGSGRVFDWRLVSGLPRDDKLFLLAGGLHAGNVKEAITCVKPDGVDVSSGVEYGDRPGKDGNKIDEFVRSVKACG